MPKRTFVAVKCDGKQQHTKFNFVDKNSERINNLITLVDKHCYSFGWVCKLNNNHYK